MSTYKFVFLSLVTMFVVAYSILDTFLHGARGKWILQQDSTLGSTIIEEHTQYANVSEDIMTEDMLSRFRASRQIFYNRVPKCGSTTVNNVLKEMARKNHYKYNYLIQKYNYNLTHPQFSFKSDDRRDAFMRWMNKCHRRCLYVAHQAFLGEDSSIRGDLVYFNVVRDPIMRLVSWFYYIRFKARRPMDESRRNMTFVDCVSRRDPECTDPRVTYTQIPFFCGQQDFCREPGEASLQQAMRNVEQHFAVVGFTEDLKGFFTALEWTLPKWFSGAASEFNKTTAMYVTKEADHRIPSAQYTYLRRAVFVEEYTFYYFIRQRFKVLMAKIQQQSSRNTDAYSTSSGHLERF